MPYEILEDSDDKFCVHKKDSGEKVGCSDSREEAEKQIAAIYANENKSAEPMSEHSYFTGGAIKAIGDGVIGGYLVAYGNSQTADDVGEFFCPETDYALDYYPERPVLYHHGLGDIEAMKIGTIYKITPDANGLYAEALLDINHEDPVICRAARIAYKMVQEGKLSWSSGSAVNLIDVANTGQIKRWPIIEGSLTRTPADQTGRTSAVAIRAAMKALTEEISALETDEAEPPKEPLSAKGDVEAEPVMSASVSQSTDKSKRKLSVKMGTIEALEKAGLSPEQIIASMKELEAAGIGAPVASVEPDGDEAIMAAEDTASPTPPMVDPMAGKAKNQPNNQIVSLTKQEIQAMIEGAMKTAPAKTPVPGLVTPEPGKTYQGDVVVYTPTQALSAEDISYMLHMRQLYAGAKGNFRYAPDYKLVRELAEKAQTAIKSGQMDLGWDAETKINHNNRVLAVKSNELDNTGVAAAAGDWVPELWSNQLWRRVRLPNQVAGQFQVVEMPSATYDLPIESTDPTVYFVPETTNDAQLSLASGAAIPDSKVGAAKVQLVAKKLALRVGFSTEMMEDSIIPFIPQLRDQALITMNNAIENVLENGDTTNSGANINGTPGAATDKFLAFNGMRYLGLITNTAVSTNAAGAAPTLQMIRQARFTLISSLNVYALLPQDLVMIVDPYTYGKMLNIDELLAWYNNGRGSTVNDGLLPNIDGMVVIPSAQLPLTNSSGVVDATAGNNIYGTAIIAAKNAWKVGYRRQVTSSLDYLPYYDAYQLTNTIRLAFKNKDTIANAVIYGLATS